MDSGSFALFYLVGSAISLGIVVAVLVMLASIKQSLVIVTKQNAILLEMISRQSGAVIDEAFWQNASAFVDPKRSTLIR
ncbi:hypothetical protein EWE75_24090 [Sphingomonas populi]|uniref:Uncharacterized protein n=1 Tax=Sphingomonas populi TaxID=2484750 RepID=A0A4Q6XQS8_9SPHN|nr:hypothetical protein [Sphingomonas populi]RZF59019.1 hypothetical protein EWE75_24090 [Sphingomonas populi]